MVRSLIPLLAAVPLMACSTLPAPTSVRVAFDRDGVRQTRATGMADLAARRRVTVSDPVRIASISKLVTAIGVMRLVEAHLLDRDADVSVALGYRVRNPAYPDTPITLRLLLSHRSSLRDDAGYVVPLGHRLSATLADPRAWDQAHSPGTWFHYTNLNFPVIASVMERATGERFDRLMQRLVLAPLRLDACFNWTTCSDRAVGHAVVLRDAKGVAVRDDLRGRWPDCDVAVDPGAPCDLATWRAGENGGLFSPQGGLRISMRDLATIGRLIARGGDLDGVRLLSRESIALLARPEWTFDGSNGDTDQGFSVGTAWQCRRSRHRRPVAATIRSATRCRVSGMPAKPMGYAPGCGSIRSAGRASPISRRWCPTVPVPRARVSRRTKRRWRATDIGASPR
ncbi:serine hydrolase [Sphingomonas sp. RB3P16]|uniref:serine hydrolase domain-containing protein n=1 Tax=Parasphingomonas frigoris TaxID=3096163 RepID=UPI002FC9DAFD